MFIPTDTVERAARVKGVDFCRAGGSWQNTQGRNSLTDTECWLINEGYLGCQAVENNLNEISLTT